MTMTPRYKIMARCQETGERVQMQFLDDTITEDYETAVTHAMKLAQDTQSRNQGTWVAEVELYTPGNATWAFAGQ